MDLQTGKMLNKRDSASGGGTNGIHRCLAWVYYAFGDNVSC